MYSLSRIVPGSDMFEPMSPQNYVERFEDFYECERELALKDRAGEGGLVGLEDACSHEGKSDDFERVLQELPPVDPKSWDPRGAPPDLVGLALSGGGIRSATFNLGVVQALGWLDVFRCVDYLSTVSGGGFLGACISSVYTGLDSRDAFPFKHERGSPESSVFRHLRNNANYLAPRGPLDFIRLPALLIRGILLHFISLAPFVILAAFVTLWLLAWPQNSSAIADGNFKWSRLAIIVTAACMIAFSVFHMWFQRTVAGTWKWRDRGSKFLGALMIAIAVAFFIDVQPPAIGLMWDFVNSVHYATANGSWISELTTSLGVSVGSVLPFFAAASACFRFLLRAQRAAVILLSLLGFLSVWAFYLVVCALVMLHGDLFWWIAGLAAALFVYAFTTIDLNYTSLHRFYRDRLSKAYLVRRPEGDSNVDDVAFDEKTDRLLLSHLSPHAPYHLINATINIDDPDEAYKKGRRATAFLFSKAYIGSETTGYLSTPSMETLSRQVNLGTAMAISGAAVAPASGKSTSMPLRFLMAMLDLRLNYWLPNPKHADRARFRLRAGIWTLFREMFGGLTANQPTVNLSDGGHFENLGIYELVRRRCRLIIASDAECDPKYEFGGLADAIRMVLIDFGTQIEMDGLDAIRRGDKHHAIGKIRYRDGQEGRLIYLKASMRGDSTLDAALPPGAYMTSPYRTDNAGYDVNPYIARYRAAHPDFPQETTADQFFDEEQFECYRALGYEVAVSALRR